jgi:hypothetical protein
MTTGKNENVRSCRAPRSPSRNCRAPRSRTRSCRAPRSYSLGCRAPRSVTRSCSAPISRGPQLQGATLRYAELQGASFVGAELQGVSFLRAQLQGANLSFAQLQGALLTLAQLQGASLDSVFVWRVRPPAADDAKSALVGDIEPGPKYQGNCPSGECDWSDAHYAELKSMIERVQPGFARDQALKRIEPLGKRPYAEDEVSATAWRELEKSSPSLDVYRESLVDQLKQIGCATEGAPSVIEGLTWQLDDRFRGGPSQEAAVAAAFLDETKCPGAKGLSAADKASLQQIIDAAPKPSPAAPKPVGSR